MKERELRNFIQDKLNENYRVISTKTRINQHSALWAMIQPGGKFLITVEKLQDNDQNLEVDNE
jgi:hypothetical protein